MQKKIFTKDELNSIIKDYDNGNGLRPYQLGEKYGRSSSSIINKLKDLKIYKYSSYRFTDDDVEFLKEYYPYGDWNFIMERFPNTSKESIITKASKLGIKMINESSWSEQELDIIRKYYSENIKLVQELLPNRTYKSIVTKAKRIGIKSREFWSNEDDNLLSEIYPKMSVDKVLKYFPNRSRNSQSN